MLYSEWDAVAWQKTIGIKNTKFPWLIQKMEAWQVKDSHRKHLLEDELMFVFWVGFWNQKKPWKSNNIILSIIFLTKIDSLNTLWSRTWMIIVCSKGFHRKHMVFLENEEIDTKIYVDSKFGAFLWLHSDRRRCGDF